MNLNKKEFDNFHIVDSIVRPDDIDNEWADKVVEEWVDIYRRFQAEAEGFLDRVGRDTVALKTVYHPNPLRTISIGFPPQDY